MSASFSTLTSPKAVVVENTLSLTDFFKHSLGLQYRTRLPLTLLIVAAFFGYGVWIGYREGNTVMLDRGYLIVFILVIYCVILLPVLVYFQAWRYYKTNKHLAERIRYTFTPEEITVEGASFSSKLTWQGLHKIEEMKNWPLIYTDRINAIRIQKKYLQSEEDLDRLRTIIRSQPVKHKLRSK